MCQRNDLAGAARGQNSKSKHTPNIKSKTRVKQTQAKCSAFFTDSAAFQAAEKPLFSVILSETKNLSSMYVKPTERFFGEKHASE